MNKNYYMGADPGKTGAVGIIDEDKNLITIIDCPVNKITHQIEIDKFYNSIKPYIGKIKYCVLEKAQCMPHDAKTRAFSYGITYGIFKALLTICGFNPIEVYPKAWKKFFRLGADKNLSINKAIKDIKGAAPLLARKKDHNRAESVLLSMFAQLLSKGKVGI
jgi:hypothetical protein